MKEKLVIIGASGHGKVIADIAQETKAYKEIMFLDDDTSKTTCLDFPIVGTSKDISLYINDSDFFVGIGNTDIREKMMINLKSIGATIPTLIHPKAIVSPFSTVGEGTVIMAGAIINTDAKVGSGCIINTSATVDHDNIIEDYVHISAGSHLGGTVHVKRKTWIGIGVTVNNNLSITEQCLIGSGAVVTKNITEKGTYVGVPARKL